MNILVTGGAGYIGSHVARALASSGHEVAVLDNLCSGHPEAIHGIPLIVGDIRDHKLVQRAIKDSGCEAIMHFAALTNVEESVNDPEKYIQENVNGTIAILNSMCEARVTKFVFSSSAAVYGLSSNTPLNEESPLWPDSPYGCTKVMVEAALGEYARRYGLAFASLRYFNAAGAAPDGEFGEDHEPETHLIPRALNVALKKAKEVHIYGTDYPTPDGTCIRDYVHVSDIADAHIATLRHLVTGKGFAYNLGSGHGFSVQEVIEACRRVTGHPIPTMVGERRPGDPARLVADASRARLSLGWKPQFVELDAIVQTAWRWHSRHPSGYRMKTERSKCNHALARSSGVSHNSN